MLALYCILFLTFILPSLLFQDAQHELARSAVKSMSLKHGQDTERARQVNAIYTEMALNNIREKEANERTNKEKLETVLKDATKDLVSKYELNLAVFSWDCH